MKFKCIWYNLDTEVKVDYVDAKTSTEASAVVHRLYPAGEYPAPCLSIVPMNGYSSADMRVDVKGGIS